MLLKKKILAALSVVTLSAVVLAGCGGSDQAAKSSGSDSGDKIVLRYAENQSSDYPTTKAANKFADLIKEKTNGKITVQVYDGAQLGDEKSVVEQMQYGGIDFARVSLSPLSEFSKNLNALQLPYLYKDGPHMWKVLESKVGDDLLASVQEKGIIGLAWVDAGARNFYTTKAPIKTLEDLKGVKIRVQESAMMMDMIRALGASPTPMPYGEVYSGLQTGIIDGAENNWPSYESTSHYEVSKYYTIDEHNRVPEMMICSKQTWDKLSADDQKIVKDCAIEAAKYEREEWAKREKSAEDKVKAGGAVITTLSDAEKKKFEDAMQPIYDKYAAPYKEIVDQIKAMQKD